jgi:hypothetical protein
MKEKQKLVVLIILAVIVWGYTLNKRSAPSQSVAVLQNFKVLAVDNPGIHWKELEIARKTEYKSNGRNPFSVIKPPTPQEIAERNNADAQKPQPGPVVPTPPPQPTEAHLPPNLKFFGYGTVPNGSPRRAFFTDGDDVYIVPEGETLLGRYRILKVGNTNLEFQEISSGLHGTVILEEPAPSPSA